MRADYDTSTKGETRPEEIRMTRPLGERQETCLQSLAEFGFWSAVGCGWSWDGPGVTRRIMQSLVKRELVHIINIPYGDGDRTREQYELTQKGHDHVKHIREQREQKRADRATQV